MWMGLFSKKKYLAPDPEVVIGNELGGGVGVLVSHAEGVHVPEDDDGDGGKEEALLPGLVATCKLRIFKDSCIFASK